MKDILLVMLFIIALGMIVAIVGFIVGADDVYGLKYIAPSDKSVLKQGMKFNETRF